MSYDGSQIDHRLWSTLESRIETNLNDILAFLRNNKTLATFYIMGWIAEKFPEIVKKIAQDDHEIGYHSWFHEQPIKQGHQKFTKDLKDGLEILEQITLKKVTHYRMPRFSLNHHTSWVIPILSEHGIRVSSSTLSGRKLSSGTIPDHPVMFDYQGHSMPEFPLNRASMFGLNHVYTGSGYFRIMPLKLIQKLYSRHTYNMAYFHPRDFDPAVPTTPLLPFYRNIMSHLGNKTTKPKLSTLIKQQSFITVGQAAEQLLKTPEKIPRINLGV